jgi:hypothetical protein
MSKQARLTPEQIVAKLRQIEVRISQGKDVIDVATLNRTHSLK